MKLLIVIVNYRTADLTIDCVRSLADEVGTISGVRVVVTDNLSGDGSIEHIDAMIRQSNYTFWAVTQPLPRNGGFAYGNNAAIEPALKSDDKPEYVLLLNPDTVVRHGAIKSLIEFMDTHPKAGIAGSRLEDPDGTVQRSAFRFPSILSEFEAGFRVGFVTRLLNKWIVAPETPAETCQTDWVAGASMIVRREVWNAIGLMDERYFMYFEEVDFCLRAKRAGWPCWYVPESRVVHLVGQASGVTSSNAGQKRRPSYWFDSHRRYFVKNHGAIYAAMVDLAFAFGFAFWRVRRAIVRREDPDPPKLLSDFIRHSVFFRGFAT